MKKQEEWESCIRTALKATEANLNGFGQRKADNTSTSVVRSEAEFQHLFDALNHRIEIEKAKQAAFNQCLEARLNSQEEEYGSQLRRLNVENAALKERITSEESRKFVGNKSEHDKCLCEERIQRLEEKISVKQQCACGWRSALSETVSSCVEEHLERLREVSRTTSREVAERLLEIRCAPVFKKLEDRLEGLESRWSTRDELRPAVMRVQEDVSSLERSFSQISSFLENCCRKTDLDAKIRQCEETAKKRLEDSCELNSKVAECFASIKEIENKQSSLLKQCSLATDAVTMAVGKVSEVETVTKCSVEHTVAKVKELCEQFEPIPSKVRELEASLNTSKGAIQHIVSSSEEEREKLSAECKLLLDLTQKRMSEKTVQLFQQFELLKSKTEELDSNYAGLKDTSTSIAAKIGGTNRAFSDRLSDLSVTVQQNSQSIHDLSTTSQLLQSSLQKVEALLDQTNQSGVLKFENFSTVKQSTEENARRISALQGSMEACRLENHALSEKVGKAASNLDEVRQLCGSLRVGMDELKGEVEQAQISERQKEHADQEKDSLLAKVEEQIQIDRKKLEDTLRRMQEVEMSCSTLKAESKKSVDIVKSRMDVLSQAVESTVSSIRGDLDNIKLKFDEFVCETKSMISEQKQSQKLLEARIPLERSEDQEKAEKVLQEKVTNQEIELAECVDAANQWWDADERCSTLRDVVARLFQSEEELSERVETVSSCVARMVALLRHDEGEVITSGELSTSLVRVCEQVQMIMDHLGLAPRE